MTASIIPARLLWTGDGPRSSEFNDVYFSRAGGLDETRHVFLRHNWLAERFRALDGSSFTIAETGFGTGLNFLATGLLWRECRPARGWLHMVSAEKHPLLLADLQRALAMWPELAGPAGELLEQYPPLLPGFHRLLFPEDRISLTLLFGDAAEQLTRLEADVDAWFLDGFAPARNSAMWSPALFAQLARLSHSGTTLATFTAAGDVRRGLQDAGFALQKVDGFGDKREMLTGHFQGAPAPAHQPWLSRPAAPAPTRVAVIGAGIAGASMAHALALRGVQVDVYDAAPGPAQGASGNPAGMVYPRLSTPAQADTHFQQQAFLLVRQRYAPLAAAGIWNPCGALVLLHGLQARAGKNLPDHPWTDEQVRLVSPAEASALAGVTITSPALFFRDAGWIRPQALCEHLLSHPNIRTHHGSAVTGITPAQDQSWSIQTAAGSTFHIPTLVLANAGAARCFAPCKELPLADVRGQIAQVPASAESQALKTVLCHGGYISPADAGLHCVGASFRPGRDDCDVLPEDNEEILKELTAALPALAGSLPPTSAWQGRASLRCQTPDYLPVVGGLPVYEDFVRDFAGLRDGNTRRLPEPRFWPGLYCSLAHGSHGFTQALLAAEILAAEIMGEPCPVPRPVLDSLHPARFWVKDLRRRLI
jgi:tRNA 5-methylaminomethyl-2-thiouridine biosynthesis bifunctional protein